MNLGGEPERDDFGLPPVDIEIPDDARELDRDVQAYRREQRALRRRQRRLRLHAPLTRDGVVLPLLASCLVLALIAGTLLTVFTAGPGNGGLPGTAGSSATPGTPGTQGTPSRAGPVPGSAPATSAPATSAPANSAPASSPPASGHRPASSPTAVLSSGKLPHKSIRIGGRRLFLPALGAAVLAIVPAGCRCTAALRQLSGQVLAARLSIYLIGEVGQVAMVQRLAAMTARHAFVGDDPLDVLDKAYLPAGLTALLVHADGSVGVAKALSPGLSLSSALQTLRPQATPRTPARKPTTSAPAATASPGSPTASPR